MWCPECGREYREGFSECAYCHVPLVEEEPKNDENDADVNPGDIDYEALQEEIKNNPELEKALNEAAFADAAREERQGLRRFRTAAERANDMKTSGVTLSVLGVLGLIVIILLMSGVIKLNLFGTGAYITYATMLVLFAVFTVTGFRSLLKVKPLTEEAVREEKKIEEIENWFSENYDNEKIDAAIKASLEDDGEDTLYYGRVDFMRDKINDHFMDLEPAFLDHVIEGIYQRVYDE